MTQSEAFDWNAFARRVREANETVWKHLEKVKYAVKNQVLYICPERKVARAILSSSNNAKLLSELADGKEIRICENDVTGEMTSADTNYDKKEDNLAKISEALGGKVVEDGIADPF